jgi:hypothetical protein
MKMTQEQYAQALQQVLNEWESTGLKPANLLLTEHNLRHIAAKIYEFASGVGRMPSAKEVSTIVKHLGDMNAGGKLQYHAVALVAPQPVDPATNLPHQDIAELRNIRTVEDISRLRPEDFQKFRNLRPASPQYKEFNERIQYIKQHNLRAPKVIEPMPLSPAVAAYKSKIEEAKSLVNNLKAGDIGSTTSAAHGGRFSQLIDVQKRLHRQIDALIRQRTPAENILLHVQTAIVDLGSRSIR